METKTHKPIEQMSISQIIKRANQVANPASGVNYDHTDRELAGLVGQLAAIVADQQSAIDKIIKEHLAECGVKFRFK